MFLKKLLLLPAFIAFVFIGCNKSNSTDTKLPIKKLTFAEVLHPYTTISPRIDNLLHLSKNELKHELDNLWSYVNKNGLPLVEKDSLQRDFKFITFLYKANSPNDEISFEVFGIYSDYHFGDMKLRRLGNTNYHYRCYKVPSNICFSYRFVITNEKTNKKYKETDKLNSNRIPHGEIKNYSYSVLDLNKPAIDYNMKKLTNSGSRIDTFKYTDKIVNRERNIYVYLPPGYDKTLKGTYPVIYLFDAFIYMHRIEVPNILDNLIAESKIEPMIAVLFDNYSTTRGTILPLNPEFKNEFVNEFIPLVKSKYNVSSNPQQNIVGGISFGGLAAGYFGLFNPDIFGKILAQSGGFWVDFNYKNFNEENIRTDWLIEQYITLDKKELKIFMDWGIQENQVLSSSRRLVRVLEHRGYNYKYIEFNGWHDWANSRKTFAEGLLYLLD